MSFQWELDLLGTLNTKTTVIEGLTLEQYYSICYWNIPFAKTHLIKTSAAMTVKLGPVVPDSSSQLHHLVEVVSLPHVDCNWGAHRWWSEWKGSVMDNGWTRYSHCVIRLRVVPNRFEPQGSTWMMPGI
jgi:hypothetical protein